MAARRKEEKAATEKEKKRRLEDAERRMVVALDPGKVAEAAEKQKRYKRREGVLFGGADPLVDGD